MTLKLLKLETMALNNHMAW